MAMKMTRVQAPLFVNAYGDGGFRIAGARYEGSVLIVNGSVQGIDVSSVEDMTPASLAAIVSANPPVEILLVGAGESFRLPSAPVLDRLRGAGIAVDCMDTGAAARTYNVLLAEERRVAALLFATN